MVDPAAEIIGIASVESRFLLYHLERDRRFLDNFFDYFIVIPDFYSHIRIIVQLLEQIVVHFDVVINDIYDI